MNLQIPASDVTRARAATVDSQVTAAFAQTEPPVTIAAVGGYGRRELFPYSDVDLLLLTETPDTAGRDRIAEFLRMLWDQGLRVSQSVHTPEECCALHEGNLELTISLLDRRFLAGDPERFEKLSRAFPKFQQSQRAPIAAELSRATRARHAKYSDTIYHLEPNVKECPGGLRDLHVVHWLRKLKSIEIEPLEDAREFIFSVRLKLHQFFGRDNNLLTFEAQDAMASDPAAWMRQYYRHARQILRAVDLAIEAAEPTQGSLVAEFREWRSRLSTPEFTVSRERVLLRNPGELQSDPGVAWRLLQFVARHGLPPARDTERRLAALDHIPASWSEFRRVLAQPHAALALRVMADLGLLTLLMPEWARIDCLVVRDFYHRYTVDEHTLVAIQSLETPKPPFAGLFTEIGHPEILRLALLLHDLGKGGGGDHARESTRIARAIFDRLALPEETGNTALFLIEHHLELSSIMTARDLGERATARQIADAVQTIERLKLLTLLTYADISAVNPTAMTPWRLEQLWRTYLAGFDELTRELATDRIHAPAEVNAETAAFLEGLPTRYLRTHSPAEIEQHRELARNGSGIELRRMNGTYRITVIVPDRPFLLASLSGALASFGMNILQAEAFSNQQGLALDVFVFADPHRTLELNPGEADRLRDVIERAALGRLDVEGLLSTRRRNSPPRRIAPSIAFNDQASEQSTLIEVVAEDRPGLLYDMTFAISSMGANIEVVLIDTEAHKALDVFYVTANGRKLLPEHQSQLKTQLIDACHGKKGDRP